MPERKAFALAYLLTLQLLIGCSDSDKLIVESKDKTETVEKDSSEPTPDNTKLLSIIKKEAQTVFDELAQKCRSFDKAIANFLELKTVEKLNQSHIDWQRCHDTYVNTRFFRSLQDALNIHHPELDSAPSLNVKNDNKNSTKDSTRRSDLEPSDFRHSLHDRLDKFPLIQGYLDSVPGYSYSGLIHAEFELTSESVLQEHLLGDEAYVAVGFHAIEFMLIGEHQNTNKRLEDYLLVDDKQKDKAALRRRHYLELLRTTLSEDIEQLTKAWHPGDGYYLSRLSQEPSDRLENALKNVINVELEAVAQIRLALQTSASITIHDSQATLAARERIAQSIRKQIRNVN